MSHVMYLVNRPPPEELFHYSDFTGLNGLITNKQIWMGDIFFLNDEKEYQLGLDLFQKHLAEQKLKHLDSPFNIFLNALDSIEDVLKQRAPLSFSLTEENDLLSQWRGYTKNGIGVSVGFQSSSLKSQFQILPCLYLQKDQNAYIEHLFELALTKFTETKEVGKHDKVHCKNPLELPHWDAINEAGSQFISQISVACAIIKEYSFREEKEWRLISFDRSNIEFLPKETYLKPIKKFTIEPKGLIKSIKVGPNPNKNLCKSSIQVLLKTNLIDGVSLSLSDIPYRN